MSVDTGSAKGPGGSYRAVRRGEMVGMLVASLRDMQWRRRRFAITAVGTALILTMTLVLAAMSASFDAEAADLVRSTGADSFVFSAQANGPFVGGLTLPAATVAQVAALPGVHSARPGILYQAPVLHASSKIVNIFGVDGANAPPVLTGSHVLAPGKVLASTKLGHPVGSTIVLGGHPFRVVGTVHSTILAGIPNVFMTVADAQDLYFHGVRLVTFVVVQGTPTTLPAGLSIATPSQAVANLVAPLASAKGALTFVAVLLWIVAALIIGSVVYLSVLERTRDFAVFKATGVSNGALFAGVGLQAVMVAFSSAIVGLCVALLLAPHFPMGVTITPTLVVAMPLLAVAVGLLASGVGMRRVATVDPATAFGGP